MAGGGSVLTLGAMMLLGMDAAIANGTNRLGILAGGISGSFAYHSEKHTELMDSFKMSLFTLPGAIIGSIYSIQIDSAMFKKILAIVMIFIIITLILPKKKKEALTAKSKKHKLFIYPAMFFIGFYGGFIQVGIGFLIMAALRHILGLNLIKTNMHKAFLVIIYTIPVIFVFAFTGNINWLYGICLALGNAFGSWFSVKLSLKKGEKLIKIVLVIAILLMATKFLISAF
jgi:uncharacterized protein